MKRALIASMLLAAPSAHADDVPVTPKTVGQAFVSPFKVVTDKVREYREAHAKPAEDHTAADVANAPPPGHESGRTDGGEHDSTMRNIGQGVLVVPRALLEIVFAPVRGTLWAYDRYSLGSRFHRLAFDDTNTYGMYPTLVVDSDYGVTLGGKFVHRNVFGAHERFGARAAFGGEFNEGISGSLRSGDRLGKSQWFELTGEWERRPKDIFFGIGNDGDAEEARHRQQLARGTATLDVEQSGFFHVRLAGALTDLEYGDAKEGPPIQMVYPPNMLTGFMEGVRNVYAELELRYDSRRVSKTLEEKGALLIGYGGRVYQMEAGGDYWHYGGDAIRFQPLGVGRTLATRLHFETVSGQYDDVAFTQLPQLGGKMLLRGYPADRFRDRVAIAGSAEYLWDISSFLLASLFVDAGRVYSSLDDLTFDDMRLGYGASLQIVDKRSFLAGVSIASSIDGGVFLNLVLDPVYEPEPRVRQK